MAQRDESYDFRKINGMDPAANWLLGPSIDDYLDDVNNPLVPGKPCIAFLIEFSSDEAVEAFNNLRPLRGVEGSNGVLILGIPNHTLKKGVLAAAVASPDWFERLLSGNDDTEPFREAPKRIVLSNPVALPEDLLRDYPDFPRFWDQAITPGDTVFARSSQASWPEGTVVMAVIDDGIAFAHERFRNKAGSRVAPNKPGSRVEYFWNMNAPLPAGVPNIGIPQPGALPGEWTGTDIDGLLQSWAPGGVVDEDLVYLNSGLVNHADPLHKAAAWRLAHGTHVLDLAAGADPADDVQDRPIIAVQLPTPVVARTIKDYQLDTYIWLAILYVLDRADRLAGTGKKLPLVINISFGYIAGPHDGSGPLETHMNKSITPDTQIILPAGNAHFSRCHAEIAFTSQQKLVEFDWMVQPNDRTQSVVEVWLPGPPAASSRMTMTVTPPHGTPVVIDETPGAEFDVRDGAGGQVGRLLLAASGGRHMFRLTIRPTDRAQPSARAVAPAGRWHLSFAATNQAMVGVAHVWVQRDDSLYGYPQRGRQSYFEHPDYRLFDENGREICDDPPPLPIPCPVTRASLLNAIASGSQVITAGGYIDRTGSMSRYSSGGPNTPPEAATPRLPAPTKPDALLPTEGSKPHPGVLAAGSRSGARVAMGGTSAASPQLARRVADALADVISPAAPSPIDRRGVAERAILDDPGVPPLNTLPPNRRAGRLPRRDALPSARYEN